MRTQVALAKNLLYDKRRKAKEVKNYKNSKTLVLLSNRFKRRWYLKKKKEKFSIFQQTVKPNNEGYATVSMPKKILPSWQQIFGIGFKTLKNLFMSRLVFFSEYHWQRHSRRIMKYYIHILLYCFLPIHCSLWTHVDPIDTLSQHFPSTATS